MIEIRFARDGTYGITYGVAVPGSSKSSQSETGTYRSDGNASSCARIKPAALPVPTPSTGSSATIPDYRGNWGLILRSNANWLGGDKDRWRTFKPVE